MNAILSALASDPNVDSVFRKALKPEFFYGAQGRRRMYLSQSDADRYNAGFCEYVMGNEPIRGQGPYSDGQFDAFCAEEERAMASLEVDVGEEE